MASQGPYTLYLSARAKRDYQAIQRYTLNAHGTEQVAIYCSRIKAVLVNITTEPLSGYYRPDIPNGYRVKRAGDHLLIYRIENTSIYVLAILHGRMELGQYFTDKDR